MFSNIGVSWHAICNCLNCISMKGDHMRQIIIFIICLFAPLQASADALKLAAGLTVEPYIVEFNDSGFETDIVREAFALEGHKVKFVYQPLLRTKLSFKSGLVDGVLTIQEHYPEAQGYFLSDEYISYHNFAISLQSHNFKINRVADLKDKSISAFQQARFALGREFELVAENNPGYVEIANQKNQIAQLFAKHNDVLVLDQRIFQHHLKLLHYFPGTFVKDIMFDQQVIFHDIFAPSHYKMAFRNEKIRDVFNRGLKRLKESGRYQQIIDSYMKD